MGRKYKFTFYTEATKNEQPTTIVILKVNELLAELGHNIAKNKCVEMKYDIPESWLKPKNGQ